MATSLLDAGDEADGIFSRRKPTTSFSYYEIEDCVKNFSPSTSKEDFPLHYAVFQGDLDAVQKLITADNMNSLDTHGECVVWCDTYGLWVSYFLDLLFESRGALATKEVDKQIQRKFNYFFMIRNLEYSLVYNPCQGLTRELVFS